MAARYRKIDPRIWNDEKFRTLSDDAKFVFLFLLTHPHMTALGAMRNTLPGLAAELGWTAKRFSSAVKESMALGIVEACDRASWIGIPNFLRYNEPEGPNSVTKAWVFALDLLPQCQEKRRLIQRCRAYLQERSSKFREAMGDAIWETFRDAIPDAKPKPCHIQEQEPEPEQEPKQESPRTPQGEIERIVQAWNAIPGVVKMQSVSGPIRTRLVNRIREHPSPLWWEEIFTRVHDSEFLTGKKTDFAASLDWVLGPKNLAKLLAGNYDNRLRLAGASKPKSLVELL